MTRHRSMPETVLAALVAASSTVAACASPPPPKVPPLTTARPGEDISAPIAADADAQRTRKERIREDYFGTMVEDPYRWLEDGTSPAVREWTSRQNTLTRETIDAIGGMDALRAEIRELLAVGFVSPPTSRPLRGAARRYFYAKRVGGQNQPTIYVRDGEAGPSRALIDGSSLSSDGTTAVDWWYPSPDGTRVAWGASESGSEESVLRVRDVATGKDLGDTIDRTRHATVAWLPDGKGFYYSRYPEAGTVPPGDEKYFCKLYFHVLGTDAKDDKLVFGEGREKTDVPQVFLSPNGRWLVVRVHRGWDRSEVYVRDRHRGDSAPWAAVAVGQQAIFDPIVRDDRLFLRTNAGAPRYKLIALAWDRLDLAEAKVVLAEGKDVLADVEVQRSQITASFMHDAASRLERFGRDGSARGAITLPQLGHATTAGTWDSDETFVGFESYAAPASVYRVGARQELSLWDRVGEKFASAEITVERQFATSKDGTRVPMFVVSKKGAVKKDGSTPVVLYGYGGFNVSQLPRFSARALSVVQRGGVWVTAILRGGGEFGEEWHRAGMLDKKQNVFDDFIACAEALVESKVTSPEKLAAVGGSNGGLLVAAAVTQRPDLFRVGLSLVPLTDMIRYHRFRIAKLWIPEYGSADDASQFKTLYAYSPYHRVRSGTRYPAMLFTTAESDSRVDPMHARKMAAQMQEAQRDAARPILLRVETKAGHGAGKPVSKLTEELGDEIGFLFQQLNVPLVASDSVPVAQDKK